MANAMEPAKECHYAPINGRLLEHFNTGERSRRTTKLSNLKPASFLDMNSERAEVTDPCEDNFVFMTSSHSSLQLSLKINASLQRGYLLGSIHFSEPNFNALMSAMPIDLEARMPALKVIP
jgi:formate dehydrogenase major subunit